MEKIRSLLTGVGGYLPRRCVSNDELAGRLETSDAWIRERTGIGQRYIADATETASFMGTEAARAALRMAEATAADVDGIIVATSTPDQAFPATALRVQAGLGVAGGFGFDLAAACSGFIYALSVADGMIRAGQARGVLVIGSEVYSRILDWQDRATCVLFGDGAGAALVEPAQSDGEGILDFEHDVDGSGGCHLFMPGGGSLHPASHETVEKKMHFVHQDGAHVFKYAVRRMAEMSARVLERNGFTKNDLALVVPHQANLRIIRAMQERLGVDDSKVMANIDRYGNTTAGTIPLGLVEAMEQGRLRKGDLVMLVSVGAGYTSGVILLRWAY
jgi:3-oxoacyl-[acyl-carrier-protein] synthase-3